jgi:hypothetical protein
MPAEPTIVRRVTLDFSDMADAPWTTDNALPSGSFSQKVNNSEKLRAQPAALGSLNHVPVPEALNRACRRHRVPGLHDEFSGPETIDGKRSWEIAMDDRTVRAALQRHWDASDANDFKAEHEIYREDAVLDYPQSGERIRGRRNIQESRTVQPNNKRFTVRRMIGSGDLWITEFVLSYDGVPSYTVSIMEFRDGLVAHETQYFADRFDPGPSRAHLVERAV